MCIFFVLMIDEGSVHQSCHVVYWPLKVLKVPSLSTVRQVLPYCTPKMYSIHTCHLNTSMIKINWQHIKKQFVQNSLQYRISQHDEDCHKRSLFGKKKINLILPLRFLSKMSKASLYLSISSSVNLFMLAVCDNYTTVLQNHLKLKHWSELLLFKLLQSWLKNLRVNICANIDPATKYMKRDRSRQLKILRFYSS